MVSLLSTFSRVTAAATATATTAPAAAAATTAELLLQSLSANGLALVDLFECASLWLFEEPPGGHIGGQARRHRTQVWLVCWQVVC